MKTITLLEARKTMAQNALSTPELRALLKSIDDEGKKELCKFFDGESFENVVEIFCKLLGPDPQ